MTDRSISPLRQRMIEDLTVRGFAAATQRSYITAVREFTVFFGRSPDAADAEDLRRYQLHMRSRGATATTMNAAVSALRFFFGVTLGRNDAQSARIIERTTLTSAAHHIVDRWQQENGDPASIANLVGRIELAPAEIRITLDRHNLYDALDLTDSSSTATEDIVIVTPAALRRRGVEAKLVTGGGDAQTVAPDAKLIGAIASARSWFADLQTGTARSVLELAVRHDVDRSHISRTLPLAFLAPDIVTAIIDGRTDLGLTLSCVKRLKLPASWQAQRKLLKINNSRWPSATPTE